MLAQNIKQLEKNRRFLWVRPWKLPGGQTMRQQQTQQQQPAQRPWPTAADTPGAGAFGSGSGGNAGRLPPPDALRIFAYGLDEPAIQAVIDSLKLDEALWLTPRLHDADAIMALRSKVKQVTVNYRCGLYENTGLFSANTC